jgi:hypothetical protein
MWRLCGQLWWGHVAVCVVWCQLVSPACKQNKNIHKFDYLRDVNDYREFDSSVWAGDNNSSYLMKELLKRRTLLRDLYFGFPKPQLHLGSGLTTGPSDSLTEHRQT